MYGLTFDGSFTAWRELARAALQAEVPPADISWYPARKGAPRELFSQAWLDTLPAAKSHTIHVPRDFMEGAKLVAYHRNEGKWDLLYRLLWRLSREGSHLLEIRSDLEVQEFYKMQQSITRDAHKMKAFVRFRKIDREGEEAYVAWHQPDHPLLRHVAPFFEDRFRVLKWTIFTPEESVAWDGQRLHWGPGCDQSDVQSEDRLEELWSCYYASIFNPARIKVKAMKAEMAVRYWKSLPEAALIEELLHNAPQRVEEMLARSPKSAASLVPETTDSTLWEQALQRCDICRFACESRAVAGQGPYAAPWLLLLPVPAGDRLLSPESETWLRAVFEDLGLPWEKLRITAAVKHVKSSAIEPKDIAACRPWLTSELLSQRPEVVLCSGLNAGLALWGRLLRWSEVEGRVFATRAAPRAMVSHDLEKMLRLPPGAERERQERRWREDVSNFR